MHRCRAGGRAGRRIRPPLRDSAWRQIDAGYVSHLLRLEDLGVPDATAEAENARGEPQPKPLNYPLDEMPPEQARRFPREVLLGMSGIQVLVMHKFSRGRLAG